MKNTNFILKKPNELIELIGTPISNLGNLTYNFILHKAQSLGTRKVTFSSSEVFKTLERSEDKEELTKVLITLTENRIVSKDLRGKIWGMFNLLSQWEEQNGVFIIYLTDKIFNTVVERKDLYYTTIQLLEQKSYKCVYSIILYEIFKKYEKINLPIFSVEELKLLTGTTFKYKSIYDFKRYVLDKALSEMNDKNKNYNYSYLEVKIGRKTKNFKFIRTEVSIRNQTFIHSDILLKTISKARQNRFVDLSYSQKAMDKIVLMYDEMDIIKGLNELYKYNSEILNFSKILISKISDIKASKQIQNQIPTKSPSVSIPTLTIDLVEPQKVLIEISKDDYEILYQMFLDENQTPNLKSVRIGFDKMNKNKYKIIC